MSMPVSTSIPFTVETRIASASITLPARAITSRRPWLGIAQITSSRPSSASPRSAVAWIASGSAMSLR